MKDNKKSDLFSRMYKKIFETLLTSLQKISKIQSDSGSKDGRIAFDKEVANGNLLKVAKLARIL